MNEVSRREAEKILNRKVKNENLEKHMFAVASIMEKIAIELEEDPEKWYKTGLLHDVDYDETEENPKKHGLVSAEILEGELPEESLKAIKAHNHQNTGVKPKNKLDKALISSDAVSGLIVATALVMPNKKMKEVRVKSIKKKFKDSSFAKNIDRERIDKCEEIGIDRKRFFELSLDALNEINEKLEL